MVPGGNGSDGPGEIFVGHNSKQADQKILWWDTTIGRIALVAQVLGIARRMVPWRSKTIAAGAVASVLIRGNRNARITTTSRNGSNFPLPSGVGKMPQAWRSGECIGQIRHGLPFGLRKPLGHQNQLPLGLPADPSGGLGKVCFVRIFRIPVRGAVVYV